MKRPPSKDFYLSRNVEFPQFLPNRTISRSIRLSTGTPSSSKFIVPLRIISGLTVNKPFFV
uniref:Uncharacterized protein n=1 Tax=Arundo donax TaxID=35708 RepID=A0A0A9B769_ARUDO